MRPEVKEDNDNKKPCNESYIGDTKGNKEI